VNPAARNRAAERGQASVELVAALPFVLLLAAIAWQCALAGHTLLTVAHAARVAARADLVGSGARRAALSALPDAMERGLEVERRGTAIRVAVRMPLLVSRWTLPVTVSATSSLEVPR
jgi:pilus assembly protein CpaE